MKIGFIVVLFCLLAAGVMSQNRSMSFESGDFNTALSKAAQEKKLLFIDFYTTWCGPCKQMSKEVFTNDGVADYFNKQFVNLKIDAEKGEGVDLAKKFQVKGFPTFVILNHTGEEVFRTVGALASDAFLEKIKKGLDPKRSPEKLKERYEKGERTPQLIYDYMGQLFQEGKEDCGKKVTDDYFNSLSMKKKVKPENFFLYKRFFVSDSLGNPKIQFLIANKELFCETIGKKEVEDLLQMWVGADLLHYVSNYHFQKYIFDKAKYQKIKEWAAAAALSDPENINSLIKIADARVGKDLDRYFDVCLAEFPKLTKGQRLLTMINLGEMKNSNDPVLRSKAVRLLKDYGAETEGVNRRIIDRMAAELEAPVPFTFVAKIDGAKSGKVIFSSFKGLASRKDTVAFDDYQAVIKIAGKDTLNAMVRFECEELSFKNSRGVNVYPNINFLVVPGERAEVDVILRRAKPPVVKWRDGGKVLKDYVELNFDILAPITKEYDQLAIDNNIKGGDIREYTDVLEDVMRKSKTAIIEFVRSHPDSYVSAMYLLDKYNYFDENEAENIFDKFPLPVQNSLAGKMLRAKLAVSKPYRNGTVAPEFVKKDKDGKEITLSQFKGKYVVLDFWGSWCGPCRASHPHLRELNKRYAPEGVVFINIAQENGNDLKKAKAAWLAAVKEDKLTWTQILNNEDVEKCNLLNLFHVNSFPTKILIGPDGKIVARAVGGSGDLGPALEKIFGK